MELYFLILHGSNYYWVYWWIQACAIFHWGIFRCKIPLGDEEFYITGKKRHFFFDVPKEEFIGSVDGTKFICRNLKNIYILKKRQTWSNSSIFTAPKHAYRALVTQISVVRSSPYGCSSNKKDASIREQGRLFNKCWQIKGQI